MSMSKNRQRFQLNVELLEKRCTPAWLTTNGYPGGFVNHFGLNPIALTNWPDKLITDNGTEMVLSQLTEAASFSATEWDVLTEHYPEWTFDYSGGTLSNNSLTNLAYYAWQGTTFDNSVGNAIGAMMALQYSAAGGNPSGVNWIQMVTTTGWPDDEQTQTVVDNDNNPEDPFYDSVFTANQTNFVDYPYIPIPAGRILYELRCDRFGRAAG